MLIKIIIIFCIDTAHLIHTAVYIVVYIVVVFKFIFSILYKV